jgi:hypothetical protein
MLPDRFSLRSVDPSKCMCPTWGIYFCGFLYDVSAVRVHSCELFTLINDILISQTSHIPCFGANKWTCLCCFIYFLRLTLRLCLCVVHCGENNGVSNCERLREMDVDQTWRFTDVERLRKIAGVSVETRTSYLQHISLEHYPSASHLGYSELNLASIL